MRSLSISLQDQLLKGLRRFNRGLTDEKDLNELALLKPKPYGLVPITELVDPTGSTVLWPHPQIFRLRKVTLLAFSTSIYEVDESTWNSTLLTTYDAFAPASTKAITAGGVWQAADFYDTWILFNGSCVVWRANELAPFGETEKVFVQDEVTIGTGASMRLGARAFYGGLSSDFWREDLEDYLETQSSKLEDGTSLGLTMDSTFVVWSSIGQDIFWPLHPRRMIYGEPHNEQYSIDRPYLREMFMRNEAGFAPVTFQGTVTVLKELGEFMIAYGNNGITALQPVTVGGRPVFRQIHVADFGIWGRGAVSGDLKKHLFLDNGGLFWFLTADLQLKKLGYAEFGSVLPAAGLIVNYDQNEDEFYIASSSGNGYVLTENGLCRNNQRLTSIFRSAGALFGIASSVGQTQVELKTGRINFNISAHKTVHTVRVIHRNLSSVQVKVESYQTPASASAIDSGWINANDDGVVHGQFGGTDFHISVRGTPGSDPTIESVDVEFQLDDVRYFRAQEPIAGESQRSLR